MLAVDGAAARALGQLVRERWRQATGETPSPVLTRSSAWPSHLEPDFEDVEVAIARTLPAYAGRREVREVEQLYLDAIAAARHTLYLENQYLTSDTVGDALIARLQEVDGPEVVILQPRHCQGWLEQTAMGVLRARLLRRLIAADRFERLRVYYPDVAGLGDDRLNVHAKVLIVDDRLLRVGSANLNNRSMGVDSECDLAIDAGADARQRAAIASIRDRLIAEHVGETPQRVAAEYAARGSLIAVIEALSTPRRGLRLLDGSIDGWLDEMLPPADWLDPQRPIGVHEPIARRAGRSRRRRKPAHAYVGAVATALAGISAAVARWWP
jgi:phosphatidylserine/phosphatidylglycerophosphate/cardiolipin synthase-like enzyme